MNAKHEIDPQRAAQIEHRSGETVSIAIGVCIRNETREERKGIFWLRAGEQWVCPECGRVYAFDSERITVGKFVDASRD